MDNVYKYIYTDIFCINKEESSFFSLVSSENITDFWQQIKDFWDVAQHTLKSEIGKKNPDN